MPKSNEVVLPQDLRLIVVDDEPDWCKMLGLLVRGLGTLDTANTIEEAEQKIKEAEEQQQPYAVAIIDMNFRMGQLTIDQGESLIGYIKQQHAYLACVVASGKHVSPDDVLDLRDDYGLDYYLQKDQISRPKIKKAIERALQRVAETNGGQAAWQAQVTPSTPTPAPTPAPTPPSVEPVPVEPTGQPSFSPAEIPVTSVHLDFHQYDRSVRIVWRAPQIGREETLFTPPYHEQELPLVIRALNVLQYPNYPIPANDGERHQFTFSYDEQPVLARLGLWGDDRVASNAAQLVGQALYRGLGNTGQNVFKTIRNASIAQRLTNSYILRFPPNAISLAALPWELMWDEEKNQALLIRGHTIDSCERYVDLDMALPRPLAAGQKLHALALSPMYGISDAVRRNEREMRLRTWDKLATEGVLHYGEVSPLTMAGLNDYLMNASTRPDIVHYFGHGIYRDGKGYLLFDDGEGGRDLVSAERLAAVLGDVRLVIIHACQSAMVSTERGLLTGVAPALSIVSNAVVAMQFSVRTASATRFTQVFYDQLLGRKRSLQEAVSRGRQVLFTETADGASWYVPTLYIRSRDSQPIYFVT